MTNNQTKSWKMTNNHAQQLYIDLKETGHMHIHLLHSLVLMYSMESKTTCTVKIPVSWDILLGHWESSS